MSMGAFYSGLGKGLSQAGENLQKFTLWDAEERRRENLERLKMAREDARYNRERADAIVGYNEQGNPITRAQYESGAIEGQIYGEGVKRKDPMDSIVDPDKLVKKDGVTGYFAVEDGKQVFKPLGGDVEIPEKRSPFLGGVQYDPQGRPYVTRKGEDGTLVPQYLDGADEIANPNKAAGDNKPVTEEERLQAMDAENKVIAQLQKDGYLKKGTSDTGFPEVRKKIPQNQLDLINGYRARRGEPPLIQETREGALLSRDKTVLKAAEPEAPARGGLSQEAPPAAGGDVAKGKKDTIVINSPGFGSLYEVKLTGTPITQLVADAQSLPRGERDTYRQAVRNQLASKDQVQKFDAIWAQTYGGGDQDRATPKREPAAKAPTRSALPADRRALFDQAFTR